MIRPQALRAGYPAPASLLERRARMPKMRGAAMSLPGVEVTDTSLGGVDCMVCAPAVYDRTIVYFHGGGYRLGTPAAWAGFAARLALASASRIVVLDYKLAPEHPFPAAVYDAVAVYGALLKSAPEPLLAGGDSAGGGLAAALALACRLVSYQLPKALVLLSPWLDLSCPTDERNGATDTDPLFPRRSALEAAEQYLQGHDPGDALASPLKGDLANFPPVLLFASGAEYLLGDTLAFQDRLARSHATVQSIIKPGLPHAWPVISPESPDARSALEAIARFIEPFRGPGGRI
jgi:acetyl esterase/lipase